MKLIEIVLAILAKGLELWNNRQMLQAGQAMQKEKEDENTIKALAARDLVDVDKLLKPPSER